MTQDFQPKKAQLIMTLRGMGILDSAALAALEQVPRELFIPQALRAHSYENASLPIACDQTISQPYIVARMTEALQLQGRELVLEIGCGSGYQAAVLAHLCRRVYSIERLKPLLVDAENRLRDLRISNISFRLGDGSKGWPEVAPFDRIILTCGCDKIPDILLQQLKIGGIMVAPEGNGKAQQLVVVTRHETTVVRRALMPVTFVPLIEGE
ncbi:protein-L-isoaspartate(D-aspartate) O-methyltransferase [Candidatus Puniceispirillum sp.]|nr:protein-L-isoaspartate(D-aspartate) O-methyltransferase [Candidatus Puniceispirillum sp.]